MTSMPRHSSTNTNSRIAFFGHFGRGNLGNDSSLYAMLHHLQRLMPNGEFYCICTGPDAVASTYGIPAVPSRISLAKRWTPRRSVGRLARRLVVGVCGEPYQWLNSLRTLKGMGALIVPGTGILHDAGAFLGWGPYDMFRWSLCARLAGCRLLFVSMGAGPLYSKRGRFLVKTALSLADFRSYRDESTLRCLKEIWPPSGADPLYPDLAFSLPRGLMPAKPDISVRRPVVGLGLMKALGRYSPEGSAPGVYSAYLETLVEFARWLLANGHDVRLLVGDVVDKPAIDDFRSLLKRRAAMRENAQIIEEPIMSVEDLLNQLAATDYVVATRFHNVLLALLLGKPTIAIAFHHKCTSLMSQMGLSEYCTNIAGLDASVLIDRFGQLQRSAESLRKTTLEKVETCRDALDEQYAIVLQKICCGKKRACWP